MNILILCWEGSTQGTQALAEILAQNLWMWRKGSAPKNLYYALDRRSLPTEDRAVDIEIPDSKFPAFLRQSSAGRTTDWFQTSLTGEE